MSASLFNLEELLDTLELQKSLGEYTSHKKRYQLKNIALDGVRYLEVNHSYNLMSIQAQVNGDGTIDIPEDYYDYVAIYVLNEQNLLVPLAKNKKINVSLDPILDQDSIPILDHNGEQIYASGPRTNISNSSLVNIGENVGNNAYPYNNRSYSGATYGAGGGANRYGYYNVDKLNGVIQLDLKSGIEEVVLDYLVDTVKSRYDVMVPAIYRESLYAWVNWKSIQYNRSFTQRDKEAVKRDFFRARRLSRRKVIRLEEWYYQNSTNQKQSIKF